MPALRISTLKAEFSQRNRVRWGVAFCITAIFLGGWAVLFPETFRQEQSRYPRVRAARANTQARLEALFQKAGIVYPPREIFLRAFKREAEFELWARSDTAGPFLLVKTYPICASSGTLGPKRYEGDLQVPEGFYFINTFNPWSHYHLSLGINYPNAADRIRNRGRSPGGDIFIHGSCVTIGCIPLRNDPIEEVFLAAVDARSGGQIRIPVHVFPCRMRGTQAEMERLARREPGLMSFWENLKGIHDFFEKTGRLPRITVSPAGEYRFAH